MMRQRISKKIIIYLFLFFTLVTINNTKLSKDFYLIKKLNIKGLTISETSQLHNELKILKKEYFFNQ